MNSMSRMMMLHFSLLTFALVSNAQKDTLPEKTLEEVIISSSKFAEKKKNLAQKISVITRRKIETSNNQNTGDLLMNTGNVYVQKSQQGGSSPVIRGFEASRVLLVVDGIRLNNAIYRSGHLQNVITVDQNMLERIEVMYGPSSTLFGSDALGGVIHLRSKSPVLAADTGKLFITGSEFLRYSTANQEKTGHIHISLAGKKAGWLQSYTFSDFGNMKMGNRYPRQYPDFGRRSFYIDKINGIDSIVKNNDDRVQKFSAYRQWDITQKILLKLHEHTSHTVNFQYSNSSDIPRYDRLQDVRNFGGSIGTVLRFAEWYYGPQKRILAAYEFFTTRISNLTELRINIHHQDIEESRQQREYRRYDRFDSRREHIKVSGFVIDARKNWSHHELTFGADGQLNNLKSVADRTNFINGTRSQLDTRYPNGKNKMNYFGLYVQHLLKIQSGRWVLNDGIRLQAVRMHSTISDNTFFNFPYTEIQQTATAITGNLGWIYNGINGWRMSANISSAFRAPNFDDAAKIFESSSALRRLVVPNPDIKPEYTYNLDLNLSKKFEEKASFEITGFYTLFRNAIALAPFTFNGQDSILYNNVLSAVYASQNVNKAFVLGFQAQLLVQFTDNLALESLATFTYGRFKKPGGLTTPMDHIPPFYGKTSVSYSRNKFSAQFYSLYNGWKRLKHYNTEGEDNLQYATPDGMPAWITLNGKAEYIWLKNLKLQAAVENILDRNYRTFGSGFSAAGRNFILTLRTYF